jgi:hypothetical protein
MAASCISLANPIVMNKGNDESFEEVYTLNDDGVQMMDKGRRFETIKLGSFHCALRKHAYSSGIHRIRIKLHYGSAVFETRSCNIRPEPDPLGVSGQYHMSPSTYSWFINSGHLVNGRHGGHKLKVCDGPSPAAMN